MNILIPHQWLLEHLDTKATPKQIQKYLSLCGPSIERIYEKEGEKVYDIEVTTNRVDAMGVRGIAREAAAILPQFGIPAQLKPLTIEKIQLQTKNNIPLPTIKNDPELCHRIMCIVIADADRIASPEKIQKRLRQVDINVHDATIDITNYIMHELGYTFHAFDYDNIMKLGGEIRVTTAKRGETFTIIDGEQFETIGGEVVFKNPKGDIIDLPAIKGTKNTSVNESTKNILLWNEIVDPQKVRFASMTHAIRTQAAQLAEKDIDPHSAEKYMWKGVEMYTKLCNANISSKMYDNFPNKHKLSSIKVPLSQIKAYLGIQIEIKIIENILQALECKTKIEKKTLIVTPPTFRKDLTIPADIIEEIARIYGYHNIPSQLMDTPIPTIKPKNTNFTLENKIKHFLTNIGWQELYTYSMVSEEQAKQSGYTLKEHLKLENPLSDDKMYLRRSLIPSLEKTIEHNPTEKNMSIFELANVYEPRENGLPDESMRLTMVSTRPYRDVKGDLEALFDQLYIQDITYQPNKDEQSAKIVKRQKVETKSETLLGTITVLANKHTAIDIDISTLLRIAKTHPTYQPIPKTMPIHEELTFSFKDPLHIDVEKLLSDVKEVDEKIIDVSMIGDIYESNITIRISYLDTETNITKEDVEPIRKKIVQKVEREFNATLVGEV